MKISNVILFLIGLALVTGCSHTGVKGATGATGVLGIVNKPDIIINANKSGVAKIVTPGNPNCTRTNPIPPGCLNFQPDEFGEVKFKLNGPSAHQPWVFISMQICKLNGDVQDCNLDLWDRTQFPVKNKAGDKFLIPDEQGKVDLTVFGDDDVFFLVNQNTVAQHYYYSVYVCRSGTNVCSTADPPVENGGRR